MALLTDAVRDALRRGGTIDITTTGRRTGDARRIEIVFFNLDGRLYISGMPAPRRRSWLANLDRNPRFTFHLKDKVKADLPATARIIDGEAERRRILPPIAQSWGRRDLEAMVAQSPLVEVMLEEAG